MLLTLITPAAVEPVTLAEVKAHLRLSGTDDDALLTGLIAAVRQQAESLTGRVLVESVWEWSFDGGLAGVVDLPLSPSTALVSLTMDGVAVDSGLYAFTPASTESHGSPLFATLEPVDEWPDGDEVVIRFKAGWPVTAPATPTTPAAIKSWMLVRIATLYEHRESIVVGQSVANMPRDFVDCLLDPYRIVRVL